MAKPIETLSIQLKFQDKRSQAVIEKLRGSLAQLQRGASGAAPKIRGLREEILAQGRASLNSVNNINAQRNALAELRNEARIGGKNFKQLTEDIKKLDAQMGKTAKTSAKRGGARQATQIAGAVISGGIFGGPEGALGAAGGAALGGVEGAFAGAAIGAVVGGFRQALGETAAYAASVEKLQIALRGVAPSAADYQSALATAAQATRELNVPQQIAIAGITRLTAAVVGAKGPVSDAELTFKNVTAAIKATGGDAQDVQGAITAMVQVFSKGKVSAEELSGQLGERLPGAVTLFAKANNMSLQELQDNLKKGTVGLNELMKFVEELGNTYGGTAKEIAQSGAEAGARLEIAINAMRLSVGQALQDVGADFQGGFEEFIYDITPSVVSATELIAEALLGMGSVAKVVAKNMDVLGVALLGAFSGAVIAAVVKAGGVIKALTLAVSALNLAMLANPIFLAAMGGALAVGGIYALTKAFSDQADEVERLAEATQLNNQVQSQSFSQGSQDVAKKLGQARRQRGAANQSVNNLQAEIEKLEAKVALLGEFQDDPVRYALADRKQKLQASLSARSEAEAAISKLKPLLATRKELDLTGKGYTDPKGDSGSGDKAASKLARRIEQAQKLEERTAAQLRLAQSQGRVGRLLVQQANERLNLEARLAKIVGDGENQKINDLALQAKINLDKKQQLQLETRIKTLYEQASAPLRAITQSLKDKVQADKMYQRLLSEGVNPELAKELVNIEKVFKAGMRKLDLELEALETQKAKAELAGLELQHIEDQIDAIKRRKEELEGDKTDAEGAARDGKKEGTIQDKIQAEINTLQDELDALVDPANQIINAAKAIGSAFKQSFMDVITGSKSAKQALADFFKRTAEYFLEMAADIIAKQLVMITLQTILKALGAAIGSSSSTTPPTTMPDGVGQAGAGLNIQGVDQGLNPLVAANGAYFQGGFRKFADGGSVNKPTFGLVGEGGESEYIIPESKMRESMKRYSRGARGSAVIPTERGATSAEMESGAVGAGAIDVRYTVERINNVDYVTADQFQQGMQRAAAEGAARGEQQTLRKLQMSGSTRRRLGM